MPSLADLRAYSRFVTGLPGFLRQRVSIDEAHRVVRRRLASRPEMLLKVAEHGIYGNPGSPYRELLRLAGCELGDLRKLAADRGVEGALSELHRAGVWVSFEEFKGRRPIVRGGRVVSTGPGAFDNPHTERYYHGHTSGSTGPGTRVAIDLDHLRASAPNAMLALVAHNVLDAPSAQWRPILPSLAGLSTILGSSLRGRVPERWFSPLARRDVRPSLKDRVGTELILAVGRLAATPLPRPELVPLERPEIVVRWVRDALDREGSCLLRGHVSGLLRVALAARELGLGLDGAVFWGGGEPPTEAKVRPILDAGARMVPTYFLSESGAVGFGCARPGGIDDMHVMTDAVAVIQPPDEEQEAAPRADVLLITTLLPSSPKLLFNVETDDMGVLTHRACGCPLEDAGFAGHIRSVRSERKLTVEGMSVLGSDVLRVLEDVLPSRFGGSPLDYQLVHEEDDAGLSRLVLLVDPAVGAVDGEAAVATVLEELRRGDDAAELARATWTGARTLTVRREAPRVSGGGKLMPLVASPRAGGAGGVRHAAAGPRS